jgi:hypothetical protein
MAQALARERRWAVFPMKAVMVEGALKKLPCRPRAEGGRGFHDASTDPGEIAWLWSHWPGPLIGVRCGVASGVSVLDIDIKHDSACAWWRANYDRVPLTLTYRTRSGGLHLYFQHAAGVTCRRGQLPLGVDIKGEGGCVTYWRAAGLECLDETPPALWPEWLLNEIKPRPATRRRPYRPLEGDDRGRGAAGILNRVAGAAEGERNAILYWATRRFGERIDAGQIGECEAQARLTEAAAAAGLTEREAIATIRSGFRRAST